ncbi:MAG: type VI secretion system membrane subunit TssM [Casimicrobiaceae bacterium]|nr:type VI secretion system membrane subunit TssM [Casimicrobiaceae bacterium]
MMRILSGLRQVLFNRITLTILLLVLLSLAIWFGGPLIAIADWPPLGPTWVRWSLIGLLWVLWLLKLLVGWWRARNINAALLGQLAKMQSTGKPGTTSVGQEEVAELNRRFKEAADVLKKMRFGASGKSGWLSALSRQYVYQLPWYVFIGAPGSGKTTALINSGLTFPLAEQFGKAAIRGVGGTRNCDWWFTNEAVLIDTAGRYTTQESNQEVDRAEWQGFLSLLKKFRPRQPLNGVLLTISVADLLSMNAQERKLHAATLKARLHELYEGLGLQLPVYVLVTKVDLLAGFNEYFLNLTREDRAQVWGFTAAYDPAATEPLPVRDWFDREFDLLYKRLNDGMHQRLLEEPDLSRRALAYTFPQQFAGIRDVLGQLLASVFTESKFNEQPRLRGVYFTSGTQEGTPFDRVLGALQRTFRVDARVRAETPVGTGKSYFLQDLLQKVIFPESFIAGRNLRAERRQRLVQWVGMAACAVAFVLFNVGFWTSYRNNLSYVSEVANAAERLREAVQSIPTGVSEDAPALGPVLSQARNVAMPGGFAFDRPPWGYRWGLWQGPKLDAAAQSTYQRLLEDSLMPRVHVRLNTRLQTAVNAANDTSYEALKAYLMMYEPSRVKADFLVKFIGADWMAALSSEVSTEARRELLSHLEALIQRGGFRAVYPLNAPLVQQAREQLAQLEPARRAYNYIKSQLASVDLPEFTLAKAAGERAPEVFVRRSGKPLTSEGVPGYFSERGYNKYFVEALGRWGAELALEDAWVLGRGSAQGRAGAAMTAATAANEMQRLERRIRELYLLDFASHWQAFLQDVRLRPPRNMAEVIDFATILGAPDSPLVLLVREVARQTQLSVPERSGATRVDRLREEARRAAQEVSAAVAAIANAAPAADRIEAIAEEPFREFIRMAQPEGKAQIDQIAKAIQEYANALRADQASLSGGATSRRATDAENALRGLAASSRTPVREILEALAGSGERVARAAIQTNASAQARGVAGAACTAVVQSYPFRRGAAQDAFPQDFAQVFGPEGSLKRAFDQVASAIDMSRDPWVPRPGIEGAAAGGPAVTRSFQLAAAIRETFFAGGRNQPGFDLDVRVVSSGERAELEADGTIFASGEEFKPLNWTGQKNGGRTFVRVGPNKTVVFSAEGFWALHRLVDRAGPGAAAGSLVTVNLPAPGAEVRIELRARSFRHPLTLPALRQFACPG